MASRTKMKKGWRERCPNELYREYLMKNIKNSLREHSWEINHQYVPCTEIVKTRDEYYSDLIPTWEEGFHRRQWIMGAGFWSKEGAPYRSAGEIYPDVSDVIQRGILSKLKSKINVMSRETFVESRKRPPLFKPDRKPLPPLNLEREPYRRDDSCDIVYAYLRQLHEMRSFVLAGDCLNSYFVKQKAAMPKTVEKNQKFGEMITLGEPNLRQVSSVSSIVQMVKEMSRVDSSVMSESSSEGTLTLPEENVEGEGEDQSSEVIPEEKLVKRRLQNYRDGIRMEYRRQKVNYIKSFLCAILNMKTRVLKTQYPLEWEVVKEYLETDVTLDNVGKPIPYKAPPPDYSEIEQRISSIRSAASFRLQSHENQGPAPSAGPTAAETKAPVSSPRKMQVKTWDDLVRLHNDGNKRLNQSPTRRRGRSRGSELETQQWKKVSEQERRISLAKFQKSQDPNNSAQWLIKVKNDCKKGKERLKEELNTAIETKKEFLIDEIDFKVNNICVNGSPSSNLMRMRKLACDNIVRLKKERKKPLKWFLDLEEELSRLVRTPDSSMDENMNKIKMFAYEKADYYELGKEKLCLMVMSFPLTVLLTQSMIDAIEFVLTRVLGGSEELLKLWLCGRNLEELSRTLVVVAKKG